jgi:hypothetical protein
MEKVSKSGVSVIGAGGVGSPTALCLAKMGVPSLTIYDEDGVSDINLPNQFYRKQDAEANRFKVDALAEIIGQFSNAKVDPVIRFYENQKLDEAVIVATDSMRSRRLVWEQFCKQPQCRTLIEARMGAQVGMVYTIRKTDEGRVSDEDFTFYEEMLYSDEKVKPLPCTARSIIYNVLMLASLICRAYKGVIQGEAVPREMIFNMTSMGKLSWMHRA